MTTEEKQHIRTAGTPILPSSCIRLKAGPVEAEYLDGYLRYISYGKTEVVRQIYAAVRDANWWTVPGKITDLRIDEKSDSFLITYSSIHTDGEIRFVWNARISGSSSGVIIFRFDGKALSTFRRNRIGFCLLHPMEAAGRTCRITHDDGTVEEGCFPKLISPQQPFFNIRAMSWSAAEGITGKLEFNGDVFEMEDQRNWTDASFKTYCTPLSLPFPIEVEKGTKVCQEITFCVDTAEGDAQAEEGGEQKKIVEVRLSGTADAALPEIGLVLGENPRVISDRQMQLLSALQCSHLRLDLKLCDTTAAYRQETCPTDYLKTALIKAEKLDIPLELALHLGASPSEELDGLIDDLKKINSSIGEIPCAGGNISKKLSVIRFFIFKEGEKSTEKKWISLAAEKLKPYFPETKIITGTDAFFTELNRGRPDTSVPNGVVYSLNPQVHAFDNNSLVETTAAQEVTVITAKSFSGGLPVHVGPVTLKMRWNPNATGEEPPVSPGVLPPQVDTRQMSLFGAAWTAASIKYLSKGGAASLTYFETVGWKGVMEMEEGSPLPGQFPSISGGVFPLYYIFRWLAGMSGAGLLQLQSGKPLSVDGIALEKNGSTIIILGNFTGERLSCNIYGLPTGAVSMITLDESNYEEASLRPESFYNTSETNYTMVKDGRLDVELSPYCVTRLKIKK